MAVPPALVAHTRAARERNALALRASLDFQNPLPTSNSASPVLSVMVVAVYIIILRIRRSIASSRRTPPHTIQ